MRQSSDSLCTFRLEITFKSDTVNVNMVDKLIVIDRKDLPVLKALYTPNGSKNYTAYTTIDTYIRWFEQDSNVEHIKFFCLNGDFSDGTFVVIVSLLKYS